MTVTKLPEAHLTHVRSRAVESCDGAFPYRQPQQRASQRRWSIIKGPCKSGEQRTKTRGRLPEFIERHGEIEPLAYLHCWLLRMDSAAPRARRSENDPTADDVTAFVAEHREELERLQRLLVRES